MLSEKQRALLHVAKQQIGLTDRRYRNLLRKVAGDEEALMKWMTAKFHATPETADPTQAGKAITALLAMNRRKGKAGS